MKLHTALLYTASVGLTSAQNYGRLDWVPSPTPHKDVQYLGMSAINKDLVWLSGTNGTIVRTTDGGAHWVDIPSPLKPEEKDSVTLKAVHAFSDHFAVVLASGKGGKSRIFLTGNAGQRWRETFTNTEDAANYQCMAFGNTDGQRAWGVAASDPVNGRLRLVQTIDAGETWNPISQTNIPDAEQGERLLEEVSSCVTFGPLQLAIATAGTKTGRVYATTNQNFALGWLATNTNLTGGADGGASTVQFSADGLNAIAVGGRLSGSTENDTVATWSTNGGYQWNYGASERNTFLSSVSWAPLRKGLAVAVGPGGSVFTRDGGKSWGGVGNDSLSVVSCNDQDMCWAAGAKGMAAKLDLSGLTF